MIPIAEFRSSIEKNAGIGNLINPASAIDLVEKYPKLALSATAVAAIIAGAISLGHLAHPFMQMRSNSKKLDLMSDQKSILSEMLKHQKGPKRSGSRRLFIPPLT